MTCMDRIDPTGVTDHLFFIPWRRRKVRGVGWGGEKGKGPYTESRRQIDACYQSEIYYATCTLKYSVETITIAIYIDTINLKVTLFFYNVTVLIK